MNDETHIQKLEALNKATLGMAQALLEMVMEAGVQPSPQLVNAIQAWSEALIDLDLISEGLAAEGALILDEARETLAREG